VLTVAADAFVPGSSGVDFTASTAVFSSNSGLVLAVNGTTVNTGYTLLNVSGAVDLSNLDLTLVGSYTPAIGDVFTLVSATNLTGTFDNVPQSSTVTFNGRQLAIQYTATAVTATAVPSAPL